MSAALTKADLDEAVGTLRGETAAQTRELRAELRGELAAQTLELRGEMAELRGDMAAQILELRGELAAQGAELRGEMVVITSRLGTLETRVETIAEVMMSMGAGLRSDMTAMEARLVRLNEDTGVRIANAVIENLQGFIAALDDKYRDLPPGHAQLRADFDAHAADERLHRPAVTPKRRRSR